MIPDQGTKIPHAVWPPHQKKLLIIYTLGVVTYGQESYQREGYDKIMMHIK